MRVLTLTIIEAMLRTPKNIRPRLQAQPFIIALVKTVVDELDAALRQRRIHFD